MCEKTEDFTVKIGVFNPYLFLFVMDKLMKNIQNESFWCIMLADDEVYININLLESGLKH